MASSVILVINCGSSSIKFQIIDPIEQETLLKGLAEEINTARCQLRIDGKIEKHAHADYTKILSIIGERLTPYKENCIGVGHRIVHGGEFFKESAIVTSYTLQELEKCEHLAPLHNPVNTLGITLLQKILPDLPQVAVFDTAFHTTLPEHAYMYALPREYYEKYQVRRYGFHGTSHRYVTEQAKHYLKGDKHSLISAHLGNGCSLCAVKNGKSIDTSMGMTPLEGLVMGQRSGDLDPSILPYLSQSLHLGDQEILNILNKKSGLLGLSGISGDMRLLEDAESKGDKNARLALEVFCYRLAKYIASYIVPLSGIDGLIFTGGIGENSPFVRKKVIQWLKPLNMHCHTSYNDKNGKEGWISQKGEGVPLLVIPTNEELAIAQEAYQLLQGGS